MNFISSIIGAVAAGIVLFGSMFISHQTTPQTFGSFTPVQGKSMTLAGAGVTSSATTVTLSSATLPDPNGTLLQMSMFGAIGYGVFEPQSSKIENFSFTGITQNANGSATLTGVSRGLSFYSPYAASTTLQISHAGGSNVILSNSAAFYGQQFALLNTNESITGTWTFASTAPPTLDKDKTSWIGVAAATLATKGYVDGVVTGGAANADTATKGLVQIATGLQAASSTNLGSTGAVLVIPASVATDTPNTATRTSRALMSDLTGYLKQGWLNLTQLFTFSGGLTSTATTTLAGSNVLSNAIILNGIPYAFPSALGASSTVLITDSNGNIKWGNAPTQLSASIISATTTTSLGTAAFSTSTLLTIPAGFLTASSTIEIKGWTQCQYSGGTQNDTCKLLLRDGAGVTFAEIDNADSATAGTPSGPFSFTVVPVTQSSQNTITQCVFLGGVTEAPCVSGGNSSSAVNYSNALQLNLVMSPGYGNGTYTMSLNSVSVIVRQ